MAVWLHRIWNLLRRDRKHRDIERELAFHLAERADELQAQGMTEQESRHAARRQFGNFTSQVERTHDIDIAVWLESLLRNLRYAARTLIKTPGFTITVIATLALGIGANSAVFSAIQAVLLNPLPFPDGDQLMELRQKGIVSQNSFVAPVRLLDWSRMNGSFQSLTGYYAQDSSELSGEFPEQLRHAFVAPQFLQVWGMAPAIGRDFSPEEERFGGPPAVLISDRLWRRRFGADPSAIGRQLRIGTSSFEIVGVMPVSFLFPERSVDVWSPSPMDAPYAQNRESTWFRVIGRLKPGVTQAQAQADLSAVQANLGRQYPKPDSEIGVEIRPLKEGMVGESGGSLWLLFSAVSVLLLIACTNIAALQLSRAARNEQDVSLRFSLGASRASVIGQLLVQSLLLALAGAALGLGLAAGATALFRGLAANLPRVDEIALDWRVVLYSLVCALVTTLLCGLYPAFRATRGGLRNALVQSSRTQVSRRNPAQLFLVGVQVALAVALLVGAGLLTRSFVELGRVAPGFDPSRVLSFRMTSSWNETGTAALRERTQRILSELEAMPGVDAAAMVTALPGVPTQYPLELKLVDGGTEEGRPIIAESRFVSAGYFSTMRIPLIAGKFCEGEYAPGWARGLVVNRSFANTWLPGSTAIGRRLQQAGQSAVGEIRGIVGDARELGINQLPVPTVYWCYDMMQPGAAILVRTQGEPMAMAETLRRKLREMEPTRSVFGMEALERQISGAFDENRLRTFLLVFFALTAVSLACIGLYGTLSYLVNVHRREIGLRLALGALRGQIVRRFLAQGLGLSFVACLVGLGLAAAFARLLSGMLYGVAASDTLTFAGSAIIVLLVACAASLVPALRAARLNPVEVLRDE